MGPTGSAGVSHSDSEEWGRQIRLGIDLKLLRPKIKTGQH